MVHRAWCAAVSSRGGSVLKAAVRTGLADLGIRGAGAVGAVGAVATGKGPFPVMLAVTGQCSPPGAYLHPDS